MGCEANCINEHRFHTIDEKIKELERKCSSDHKEFYDRIEDLEKENAVSRNDMEHIRDTVDEMNENLKSLMQQPAKRYDTIVVATITAIIAAVVAFLLRGALPM